MPSRYIKARVEREAFSQVEMPPEILEAMRNPAPPPLVTRLFGESEGPSPESEGPYPVV